MSMWTRGSRFSGLPRNSPSTACVVMRCWTSPDGRTVGQLVASASGAERGRMRVAPRGSPHESIGLDQVARFGAITIKDVAGYDTKRIFIGGGGSFGDLEQLTFKLTVQPRH